MHSFSGPILNECVLFLNKEAILTVLVIQIMLTADTLKKLALCSNKTNDNPL